VSDAQSPLGQFKELATEIQVTAAEADAGAAAAGFLETKNAKKTAAVPMSKSGESEKVTAMKERIEA